MLTITENQAAIFEADARRRLLGNYKKELLHRQPQATQRIGDKVIDAYIEVLWKNGRKLRLDDGETMLRFFEVGLMPLAFPHDTLVSRVIEKMLSKEEIPIEDRVNFLYRQIVLLRARSHPVSFAGG